MIGADAAVRHFHDRQSPVSVGPDLHRSLTGVGARRNLCPSQQSHAPISVTYNKGKRMSILEYVKLLEYAHKLEVENEKLRQCVMVHEHALVALWTHARRDVLS